VKFASTSLKITVAIEKSAYLFSDFQPFEAYLQTIDWQAHTIQNIIIESTGANNNYQIEIYPDRAHLSLPDLNRTYNLQAGSPILTHNQSSLIWELTRIESRHRINLAFNTISERVEKIWSQQALNTMFNILISPRGKDRLEIDIININEIAHHPLVIPLQLEGFFAYCSRLKDHLITKEEEIANPMYILRPIYKRMVLYVRMIPILINFLNPFQLRNCKILFQKHTVMVDDCFFPLDWSQDRVGFYLAPEDPKDFEFLEKLIHNFLAIHTEETLHVVVKPQSVFQDTKKD